MKSKRLKWQVVVALVVCLVLVCRLPKVETFKVGNQLGVSVQLSKRYFPQLVILLDSQAGSLAICYWSVGDQRWPAAIIFETCPPFVRFQK